MQSPGDGENKSLSDVLDHIEPINLWTEGMNTKRNSLIQCFDDDDGDRGGQSALTLLPQIHSFIHDLICHPICESSPGLLRATGVEAYPAETKLSNLAVTVRLH